MEDGGFWGSFGTFLFWFFTIFGAVIGLALIGVLVWLYLQIRMYLVLVDKVMAVTESGLRFVGIEKKLTKFGLFKMALRFLLSKKARANAIVSARGFVTTRLFTRKKGASGAAMLEKAKRVASKNEEKLLEMAYNEAVNFAKAEAGKVLAGEPLNLAEDAKQAALSGGKELLKTAGGEALDFAQGELRKAVAGEAPEAEKLPGGALEGEEGKAETLAAKDSAAEAPVAKAAVAEAQGEAPAEGKAAKGSALGRFLTRKKAKLAKDAKQAALSGGKELLKTAGGEALDFAQGEIRKAVAGEAPEAEKLPGGEPEGEEGKAEAIAEEAGAAENAAPDSAAEAQGETVTAGGTSPAVEKICRGMERLLSQEKLDEAKLVSVVDKLLSPDLKLDIPRKQWVKWGKLARERGAYEIAALLLEKAASEL